MNYRNGLKRILAVSIALWFLITWGYALSLLIQSYRLMDSSAAPIIANSYVLREEAFKVFRQSFTIPMFLYVGISVGVWVVKWVYRGFKSEL